MYCLIHEYGDYSHSEILCESFNYEVVKTDYLFAIEQTLTERDSTTDALYIEDEEQNVIIEHIFNPETN
jgi:hypothetical protein